MPGRCTQGARVWLSEVGWTQRAPSPPHVSRSPASKGTCWQCLLLVSSKAQGVTWGERLSWRQPRTRAGPFREGAQHSLSVGTPPPPQHHPGQDLGYVSGQWTWGYSSLLVTNWGSQGSCLPDLTTTLQQIHSKLRCELHIHRSYCTITSPKHRMVSIYLKVIYLIY